MFIQLQNNQRYRVITTSLCELQSAQQKTCPDLKTLVLNQPWQQAFETQLVVCPLIASPTCCQWLLSFPLSNSINRKPKPKMENIPPPR